jgi:tellurite resistance protein
MATVNSGVIDADPRARATALLSRYPDLSEQELGELDHWFRKQATALDVGLLASEPSVAAQFRAYRNLHHDRFTTRDMLLAATFLGVAVAAVGGMLML